MQNLYNLAHRHDDPLVDRTAREGIAFVSFFPLGGIAPLQSEALSEVARSLNATSHQVALGWLLQRSPNSVVIPGTSSVAHLRQNVAAAETCLLTIRALAVVALGRSDLAQETIEAMQSSADQLGGFATTSVASRAVAPADRVG